MKISSLFVVLVVVVIAFAFAPQPASAMTKAELISAVASSKGSSTGVSKKQVQSVVDGTFEAIKEALASGRSVSIPGFGTFRVISDRVPRGDKRPRPRRLNPPAQTTVSFRPAQELKDFVGNKKK